MAKIIDIKTRKDITEKLSNEMLVRELNIFHGKYPNYSKLSDVRLLNEFELLKNETWMPRSQIVNGILLCETVKYRINDMVVGFEADELLLRLQYLLVSAAS